MTRVNVRHMTREHVNVYLEEDLAVWVKKEAARRRCSVSQVIREILLAAAQAAQQKPAQGA